MLLCPSSRCSASRAPGIQQLLKETPWRDGVVLQCPLCSVPLLPCECCGRVTQPSSRHELPAAAAASAASASAVAAAASSHSAAPPSYSLGRCTSCSFLTLLPSRTSTECDLRGVLSLPSLFPWSFPRAWGLQLALDRRAAIAGSTQRYLDKLDEFKTLSAAAAARGSGSAGSAGAGGSSSSPPASSSRLGGAQVLSEEGKSATPDSTPPLAQRPTASSSVAFVEQQLLRAREHLLQLSELRDQADQGAAGNGEGEQQHPPAQEFTQTHLRVLQMLCAPSSSSSSPLLPPPLLELVSSYMVERPSLLRSRRAVDGSWGLVRGLADLSASAAQPPAAAHDEAALHASSTLKVLLNIVQCDFEKQEMLHRLRSDCFRPLLASLNDLLGRLYDLLLLSCPSSADEDALPPSLHSTPAPPLDASEEEKADWAHTVRSARAVEFAQSAPSCWTQGDPFAADLAVVTVRSTPSHLPLALSDIVLAAEYARLLFLDVHATLAVREYVLQRPVAHAVAAAGVDAADPAVDTTMEDASAAPAQAPAAAVPTPAPRLTLAATSARKQRKAAAKEAGQQTHVSHTIAKQSQQAHHAHAVANKTAQAFPLPQRHHPYQR